MIQPSHCLLLSILIITGLHTAGAAHFPQERSDLPADPRVTWGVLDNGVRYAIMPNNEPPDRVSLRLYVGAGSLMEEDDQAGLAHYLEHMAFNGSEHYPPGELVEYLQRIGMSFGADTNAHTGFDETVYKLELPENSEKFLREGMQIFRDYAGGLLLLESEIDRERGVILSEKRARDSARYRTIEAWFAFLFPESLIAHRLPIGRTEVIENAHRQQFVDFYTKWYTPGRMAVTVAGAVDPETTAALIREYFSTLPTPETPAAEPDLGRVAEVGLATRLHSEPELPATTISLMSMRPDRDRPDTLQTRTEDLLAAAANRIVSRRIESLAKLDDSPFSEGYAAWFNFLTFADIAEIELTCRPEEWQDALPAAEQILRQALEFGFTEAEINEARANILQDYRQALREAPTRHSRQLSAALASSLGKDKVFTSPGEDLRIAEAAMEQLTPETALEAFRHIWSEPNWFIFVSGNLVLDNGDERIAETFITSMQTPVEPPPALETPDFAYDDFGPPGQVINHVHHEDLDIHQASFANNVRLNFKQTDFEAGQILVFLRFGSGKLAMTEEQPGIALLASATFIEGGLETHSLDEIQRITAGRQVSVNFAVDEDCFILSGTTNPDDVQLQLQLLTAYLTAPGYRPEALRQAHQGFDQLYVNLAHTAEGILRDRVSRFLASGSFRFGFPGKEQVLTLDLDDVRTWLSQPLAQSTLEVNIVGDLSYAQALDYTASTLGALPARNKELPADSSARQSVSFPRDATRQHFTYTSEIPRAIATVFWPTTDFWNIERTRRLNLLAAILRDRLRREVREKLGEGYSPYAVSDPSETYPGYGYLMALNSTDPARLGTVADIIVQLGQDLSQGTITEDELDRARRPIINHIAVMRRDNTYWLRRVLSGSTQHPEQLDFARTLEEGIASITLEDLNQTAQTYLQHPLPILISPAPLE